MRILYQREIFDSVYPEALPLLEQHHKAIATFPDISLNIDAERYRESEMLGFLRLFTARWDRGAEGLGGILAYAGFMVGSFPHAKQSVWAVQDVLYVDPEQVNIYRRGYVARELLRFCDRQLKAEGVQVVRHHISDKHPALGVLLAKEGYALTEHVYSKRLDR